MYSDIERLTTATQQLAATRTTIITAPADKKVQIGTILLHNTNSSAEVVKIGDGGTDATDIFHIELAVNETYEFAPKVPIILAGSETLQGLTTNASKVNIKIYGRTEV